ncbi:MAG: hypothetical protein IID61_14270 [SAR324 cluster bacterium]|nr:hypothetical protein [SAR324 cluster bacterium]
MAVAGGFNGWDGWRHPMRRLGGSGGWELFIPSLARATLLRRDHASPYDHPVVSDA